MSELEAEVGTRPVGPQLSLNRTNFETLSSLSLESIASCIKAKVEKAIEEADDWYPVVSRISRCSCHFSSSSLYFYCFYRSFSAKLLALPTELLRSIVDRLNCLSWIAGFVISCKLESRIDSISFGKLHLIPGAGPDCPFPHVATSALVDAVSSLHPNITSLDFGEVVVRDHVLDALSTSRAAATMKSLVILAPRFLHPVEHVWPRFESLESLEIDARNFYFEISLLRGICTHSTLCELTYLQVSMGDAIISTILAPSSLPQLRVLRVLSGVETSDDLLALLQERPNHHLLEGIHLSAQHPMGFVRPSADDSLKIHRICPNLRHFAFTPPKAPLLFGFTPDGSPQDPNLRLFRSISSLDVQQSQHLHEELELLDQHLPLLETLSVLSKQTFLSGAIPRPNFASFQYLRNLTLAFQEYISLPHLPLSLKFLAFSFGNAPSDVTACSDDFFDTLTSRPPDLESLLLNSADQRFFRKDHLLRCLRAFRSLKELCMLNSALDEMATEPIELSHPSLQHLPSLKVVGVAGVRPVWLPGLVLVARSFEFPATFAEGPVVDYSSAKTFPNLAAADVAFLTESDSQNRAIHEKIGACTIGTSLIQPQQRNCGSLYSLCLPSLPCLAASETSSMIVSTIRHLFVRRSPLQEANAKLLFRELPNLVTLECSIRLDTIDLSWIKHNRLVFLKLVFSAVPVGHLLLSPCATDFPVLRQVYIHFQRTVDVDISMIGLPLLEMATLCFPASFPPSSTAAVALGGCPNLVSFRSWTLKYKVFKIVAPCLNLRQVIFVESTLEGPVSVPTGSCPNVCSLESHGKKTADMKEIARAFKRQCKTPSNFTYTYQGSVAEVEESSASSSILQ